MLHMVMEKIKKKTMCEVIRLAIGFRAGYHHDKVDTENKNTLLEIISPTSLKL